MSFLNSFEWDSENNLSEKASIFRKITTMDSGEDNEVAASVPSTLNTNTISKSLEN